MATSDETSGVLQAIDQLSVGNIQSIFASPTRRAIPVASLQSTPKVAGQQQWSQLQQATRQVHSQPVKDIVLSEDQSRRQESTAAFDAPPESKPHHHQRHRQHESKSKAIAETKYSGHVHRHGESCEVCARPVNQIVMTGSDSSSKRRHRDLKHKTKASKNQRSPVVSKPSHRHSVKPKHSRQEVKAATDDRHHSKSEKHRHKHSHDSKTKAKSSHHSSKHKSRSSNRSVLESPADVPRPAPTKPSAQLPQCVIPSFNPARMLASQLGAAGAMGTDPSDFRHPKWIDTYEVGVKETMFLPYYQMVPSDKWIMCRTSPNLLSMSLGQDASEQSDNASSAASSQQQLHDFVQILVELPQEPDIGKLYQVGILHSDPDHKSASRLILTRHDTAISPFWETIESVDDGTQQDAACIQLVPYKTEQNKVTWMQPNKRRN